MSSFVPFKINKRPKHSNSPKGSRNKHNLFIRVVEAVGLPASDFFSGTSDPFCKIYLQNNTEPPNIARAFTSDITKKSTDPILNTATSFEISDADLQNSSLQIALFDHDKVGNNEELGNASLALSHFQTKQLFQGWLPVRDSEEYRSKKQSTQDQKESNRKPETEDSLNTTDDKASKKKKLGRFSQKMSSMKSKMTSNDTLNNIYKSTRKVATTVASQVADHVTGAVQQHGKRRRDAGRVYVVIRYNNTKFEEKETDLQIIHTSHKLAPIKVFALTFNAGNCTLADFNESLPQWLPKDGDIDLYVLGFQELNQKKAKSDKKEDDSDDSDDEYEIESEEKSPQNGEEIDDQQRKLGQYFSEYLGSDYVSVAHRNMWQTRLFVFAKTLHSSVISNVISDFAATGLGGFGPNKGGVAVSLEFDGVFLCFVSTHLAAHQTKLKERNAMYSKICKNLKVGWRRQQIMEQFHCVIFMGDLNYRVDFFGQAHEDKPEIAAYEKACLRLKNAGTKYDKILENDQLNKCRKLCEAFVGFEELKIAFAPTFKVQRQAGLDYITKRMPAWCDRILWKGSDGLNVSADKYVMYENVSISDHKPVSCLFTVPIWNRACAVNDGQKAMLHFRNVSAEDLASTNINTSVNGKSDKCVWFQRQLLLNKHIESKSVSGDIAPFELKRNSLDFLRTALLLFQIKDREQLASVMDMDVIGYGCLELREVVNKVGKWAKFEKQITLNGMKAGTFKGEIKLVCGKFKVEV